MPQRGLARIDMFRQRQAMVYDFRIVLQMEGQVSPLLHELKVIVCSKSRYNPPGLHTCMTSMSQTLGLLTRSMEWGTVDPVETKLLSFGEVTELVFGHFGECSDYQ